MDAIPLIGGPADGRFFFGPQRPLLWVRCVSGGLIAHTKPHGDSAPYRLVLSDTAHYEYEETT